MQYFLLIIKQQQTITVKIFLFLLLVTATILNGRGAVTILKWDQLRTIPDQFDLIWFTGLGGEDLNVNKLQLRPGEHKNNI